MSRDGRCVPYPKVRQVLRRHQVGAILALEARELCDVESADEDAWGKCLVFELEQAP